MPQMSTSPLVGARLPVSICMVVVLPAPFGPSSPRTSPRLSCRETSRTARLLPYDRDSARAETVDSELAVVVMPSPCQSNVGDLPSILRPLDRMPGSQDCTGAESCGRIRDHL